MVSIRTGCDEDFSRSSTLSERSEAVFHELLQRNTRSSRDSGDVAFGQQLERSRNVGVADVGDRGEDVDLADDHPREVELTRCCMQADEENTTSSTDADRRGSRRMWRAARLDDEVEANAVGEIEQEPVEILTGRVHHLARAERGRDGEPLRVDVDRDDASLDRSACGTGTCARMATLWARGRLGLGQPFRHEGILGTTFVGCLVEAARVGPYEAVVPTLSGSAWITGIGQYVLDAEDPFPEGFTLGDLWASA